MRSLVVSLLVIVAILFSAAFASAEPRGDAAELKAQGDTLFDEGRYAEAYEAYKRAYAEGPDPALLYNEARALEAMGEYPEALDKLEAFSAEAPPEVRAKVPRLEELIVDLRARTCTLHVITNAPGARLYVRGKDMGPIGGRRTVRTRSGEMSIGVTADGYEPYDRSLHVPGGGVVDVDASLKRTRAAEPRSGGLASKWWFWTALGVVVAGGAAATAVALTTEKEPQRGEGFRPGQLRVQGFAF